jgi:hypothetical protein
MTTHNPSIDLEVWLYGPLARYAGDANQGSHARLDLTMPADTTLRQLIVHLNIPADERGITFVNGNLAALPGLDESLDIALHDRDRIGISHRMSMWPFQYRLGAQLTPELQETFRQRDDRGIHHAYTASPSDTAAAD